MNQLLCPDSVPSLLHFFDPSIAPQLLFYTYLPAILVSIFLGIFVFKKDNKSLVSKLFLGLCTFFTLWVLDIFILWIGAYNSAIMFGWQLTPAFEVPIFIFSIYFTLVMTDRDRKDISRKLKLFFIAVMATVFLILPTILNITNYDISNCEGIPGRLFDFMYIGEMIAIVSVLGICVRAYRSLKKGDMFKKEIVYLGFGIISFMVLFVGSNIIGQVTGIQEISFFGSLGMVLFLSFLVYLIIQFKEFNIKLLGAQALVWSLVILVGSQFFYLSDAGITVNILTGITLVISSALGLILIRSVKKEVSLREKLQVSNDGQANLIHIMNHQIKGHLGIAKNIFAELLTDDYGKVPETAIPLLEKGLEETDAGVVYVTGILKGASAESGTLPYDMSHVDIKELVSEVAEKEKEIAIKKGLTFDLNIEMDDYETAGDSLQLSEAFRNLIENSIYYTPTGNIWVNLKKTKNTILLSVKDTGVGVKEQDRAKLFKAGGMGADSLKINVRSSGYGLAFVKGVIEAHKGKVWFESAGSGKGSVFFAELPIV